MGWKPVPDAGERAAAQERQVAVIEDVAVEIAHAHAGRRGAHEAVERLVEKRLRGREADLMRQVAAHHAFAGVGIVGLADAGEQQQARVVERPGAEEHQVGGLEASPRRSRRCR